MCNRQEPFRVPFFSLSDDLRVKGVCVVYVCVCMYMCVCMESVIICALNLSLHDMEESICSQTGLLASTGSTSCDRSDKKFDVFVQRLVLYHKVKLRSFSVKIHHELVCAENLATNLFEGVFFWNSRSTRVKRRHKKKKIRLQQNRKRETSVIFCVP